MDYKIYHGFLPCCLECQIIKLSKLNWIQFNKSLTIDYKQWNALYDLIYQFNYQNADSVYYHTYFLKKITENISKNIFIIDESINESINESTNIVVLSTQIDKYLIYIELLINLFPIRRDSISYYKAKKIYFKNLLIRDFSKNNYEIISKHIIDKSSNWFLDLNNDVYLKDLSYLLISLSKLDLNNYIIPIINTFESLYKLKSKKYNTNLLNYGLLDTLYSYVIGCNNLLKSMFKDYLTGKNIELIINNCNTVVLDEIYNKNNLNKMLLNSILNRNKYFLKNLYKLFRLNNNNPNYIELIDNIICDNLQFLFEKKNINDVLIYSQHFIYCITFIKPWPIELDTKYEICLKKHILFSKNFSKKVLNIIIDYFDNDKELFELIIPSTFSYIMNFINDKQQFIDDLNYNIIIKLFSFYYKNKSLYSIEYNKYKSTISFFVNII